MGKFIISTTPSIEGQPINAYLGTINTNIVIGTNFFSDFAASFTDVFGGSSETYQRKMDQMYETAKMELIKKAKKMGGNCIVGFKIDFDEISGKGKSMFMLSASGTACLVEERIQKANDINNDYVDSNRLNEELHKYKIIDKIKGHVGLDDNDWEYLNEYPSKEIASLILQYKFIILNDDSKKKLEYMLSRLDQEDAEEVVYSVFSDVYKCPEEIFGPGFTHTDYSKKFSPLIRNCKLFSPRRVLEIIDKDLDKAILVLDCEKPYYNREDLSIMKEICTKLDNLPNVGEKSVGKNGMFSKEKELFICRNGHKNDGEVEFCPQCGENIKGLTNSQVEKINDFKKKVCTLESLL